jgi:hypothetical protein
MKACAQCHPALGAMLFARTVGRNAFAQCSVIRYDVKTMKTLQGPTKSRLISAAEAFIDAGLALGLDLIFR